MLSQRHSHPQTSETTYDFEMAKRRPRNLLRERASTPVLDVSFTSGKRFQERSKLAWNECRNLRTERSEEFDCLVPGQTKAELTKSSNKQEQQGGGISGNSHGEKLQSDSELLSKTLIRVGERTRELDDYVSAIKHKKNIAVEEEGTEKTSKESDAISLSTRNDREGVKGTKINSTERHMQLMTLSPASIEHERAIVMEEDEGLTQIDAPRLNLKKTSALDWQRAKKFREQKQGKEEREREEDESVLKLKTREAQPLANNRDSTLAQQRATGQGTLSAPSASSGFFNASAANAQTLTLTPNERIMTVRASSAKESPFSDPTTASGSNQKAQILQSLSEQSNLMKGLYAKLSDTPQVAGSRRDVNKDPEAASVLDDLQTLQNVWQDTQNDAKASHKSRSRQSWLAAKSLREEHSDKGADSENKSNSSGSAMLTSTKNTDAASSGDNGYRERLTAFYRKHNPDKLLEVDKTLAKFAGKEEQLFQKLEEKYINKFSLVDQVAPTITRPEHPQVFLDVKVGPNAPPGRIVCALLDDVVPLAANNFLRLCKGDKTHKGAQLTYKGNKFHRVIRDFMIQAGDITAGDGTGGISVYVGTKDADLWGNFRDETFLPHSKAGLLSMANSGKNTNGSQFFITTKPNLTHLNNKHVVFGEVIAGLEVVDRIQQVKVDNAKKPLPSNEVHIMDCGVLEGSQKMLNVYNARMKADSQQEPQRVGACTAGLPLLHALPQ